MADERPGGTPEHPEDDDRPVAHSSGPSADDDRPGAQPSEPSADDRPSAQPTGPSADDRPSAQPTGPSPTPPSGYPTTPPSGSPTPTLPLGAPGFELPVPPTEPGTPPLPVPADSPRRGSMHRQEPGVTTPRPPTVAEARAREKARKRAEEQARAEADTEAAKKSKRKKLLIGGVAVIGVAGLVGGGYLAYAAITAPDDVTAYCTIIAKKGQQVAVGNGQTITATQDNQEIVVPDNYCDDASRSSHGGGTGIFILAGNQYRYYYGGSNTVGKPPVGGTTVKPKGAEIKTKSGTTIQRGGLGTRIGGGS